MLNLLPERLRRCLHVSCASASVFGLLGLMSRRLHRRLGTSSRSSSSRFGFQFVDKKAHAGDIAARPVEAGDEPTLTGSAPATKTIGIVVVACLGRKRTERRRLR